MVIKQRLMMLRAKVEMKNVSVLSVKIKLLFNLFFS